MKISFALALGLTLPALASATYSLRPSPAPAQHTWFCTADGYDYNGVQRSISGGLKGSRPEAANDALRVCRGFYSACSVASCFQEQ